MYVVAVASQKGGSGKTTLAGHIAVEAERANAGPVALIDTDPQGSLAEWWNEREAESPLFASNLDVDGVELLVVDTAPQIHLRLDLMQIADSPLLVRSTNS